MSRPGAVTVEALPLPRSVGDVALVTLAGTAGRPPLLGHASLAALDDALDRAASLVEGGAVAVAVTGRGQVFCAGADLTELHGVATREDGLALARLGHRVLRRLAEMRVPSFALVRGTALGGGLELALHCTYRALAPSARAVGSPEVSFGVVPGWGGCFLLPHLLGPDQAVAVAVELPLAGRTLDGTAAAEAGLADALLPAAAPATDGEDVVAAGLAWVARVLAGDDDLPEAVAARRASDVDAEAWLAAVQRGRVTVDAATDAAPAVRTAAHRALDLVAAARTRTREEAFAAEDDALADLLVSVRRPPGAGPRPAGRTPGP